MKNTITRVDALNYAINAIDQCTETDVEVVTVLGKIRDSIAKSNSRKSSDEAKAKQTAKRKEQTAQKRAEMASIVVPILRKVIVKDMTAKEIFESAKEFLPADFTAGKVQTILLREMKDELIKTESKNKANTYRLAKKED